MIEGQKLREIREARGITQAAVASVMGIDPARVSVIESDRRGNPQPETVVRYLKAVYPPGTEIVVYTHVRVFADDVCVIEAGGKVE